METTDRGDAGMGLERFPADRYKSTNHYQTLGINKDATQTEIRHAYFRLKSVYTSGNQALYSLISDQELDATIARIEQAFEVLNNVNRRQQYNRDVGIDTMNAADPAPYSAGPSRKGAQNASDTAGKTTTQATKQAKTDDRESEALAVAGSLRPAQESGNLTAKTPRLRGVAVGATQADVKERVAAILADNQAIDGLFLKRLRTAVGVSEEEMQLNTKISASFIGSLENDRLDELPQATYAKGFVKSYLRYLGISDPKEIVEAFFKRA